MYKSLIIILTFVAVLALISLLPIIIPSESYNEAIKQFGNRMF